MQIVWDEPERQRNLQQHGFDFADARSRFVFADALIVPSYPGRGGRPRFVAVGPLDERVIAIVFAPLGTEALSLISMRIASRRERRQFEQARTRSSPDDGRG